MFYAPVRGFKRTIIACRMCIVFLCAVLALVAVTAAAKADPVKPVGTMPSKTRQAAIIDNLERIEGGDLSRAGTMIDKARHPLARRLYHWLYYQSDADNKSPQAMRRFVRRNNHLPGIEAMRIEIERMMEDDSSESTRLVWYGDFPPLTSSGMRAYLAALEARGKHGTLRAELHDWWRQALMRPDDQRAMWRRYGDLLTPELHKERIATLMHNNHFTNARRLAARVGDGYPRLVRARIALRRQAEHVESAIDAVPRDLRDVPGLRFDRVQWRREHELNDRAALILNDPPSYKAMYDPGAWWHERHIIARRYIAEKKYAKAYRLVSNHVQQDGLAFAQAEWLAGWLALRHLDKPRKGFFHFHALYKNVSTPISRSRGAYWLGRAAEAMERGDVATAWYKEAAGKAHSFYGQMARKALPAAKMQRWPKAVKAKTGQYDRLTKDQRLVMAGLLVKADMDWAGEKLLRRVMKEVNTPGQYHALARYADKIGLLHTAVRIAKEAARHGHYLDAYIYPVPDNNLMRMHGLEDALVLALIRQESLFDDEAVSGAGARGLMQLMPATARDIAARADIGHDRSLLTDRPMHNVALGTRYLRQLLDRFGGSYVLALAAYNAGKYRVEEWIDTYGNPRRANISRIDWIESIPIYETRNYVQRVLEGVYGYRHKLGGVDPQSPFNARRYQMVER